MEKLMFNKYYPFADLAEGLDKQNEYVVRKQIEKLAETDINAEKTIAVDDMPMRASSVNDLLRVSLDVYYNDTKEILTIKEKMKMLILKNIQNGNISLEQESKIKTVEDIFKR